MNVANPLPWLFIFILILAVIGAIAAIIWRSWIVGSILLVFVGLIFGLYMARVTVVPSAAPGMVNFQEATTRATPQWEPDIHMLETADVYPSLADGFKFVALKLCDNIDLSQPSISPKCVRIVSPKKDSNTDIVREIFKDKYPAALVVSDDSHNGDPELIVNLSVTDSDKTTKCLKFTAKLDARTFPSAEACVKEHPWVWHFDEYRSAQPDGELIVGWSPGPEMNQESARQQARQDAARQMVPFATAKFLELRQPNADPDWLRSRLENELKLNHHHFVKDEFVQKLHLPATAQTVYRAAILVDASSSQLDKLRGSILPELHRNEIRVKRFGGGVMGMGLVICLVYLFLNWATRGYFQMNLRLGAFLVLIAGVLLIMLIS